MYHYERQDSWITKGWIWMTWIVAFGILIPWQGLVRDARQPKPALTAEHVRQIESFLDQKVEAAKAAGGGYSVVNKSVDIAQITAVRNLLPRYSLLSVEPGRTRAESRCDATLIALDRLAIQNAETTFRQQGLTPAEAKQLARSQDISAAVPRDLAMNFRPDFLPELPASEVHWTWTGAATRFAFAWLFTLVPAFGMILSRSKERNFPLLQEVVLRPWVPLCAVVFWWWGFTSYATDSRGTVERRYRRLLCEFQGEPTEAERAQMFREASGRVLSFEAALARVQNAGGGVVVRSRRAAFTSVVVACITTPIQFVASVATAMAQTVRATSNAAETIEPKKPRGSAWAYFQETASSDGLSLGLARFKGSMETDGGRVEGEVNGKNGELVSLSVTRPVAPGVSVLVGRIVQPTAWDISPPFNDRTKGSQVSDLVPSFFGDAVGATLVRDGASVRMAVVDGARDGSIGFDARVDRRFGPLTLAVTYADEDKGGQRQQYRAGFATFAHGGSSVVLGAADRSDLRQSASFLTASVPCRGMTLSGKAEWPRALTVTAERMLGWKTRLLGSCALGPNAHPAWQLMFQQAVSFSGP